jgi:hypothetical protein
MPFGSWPLLILMAKSFSLGMNWPTTDFASASHPYIVLGSDFASSIAFGEGCLKGFVIRAVMQLGHFRGYPFDHFFNSIR